MHNEQCKQYCCETCDIAAFGHHGKFGCDAYREAYYTTRPWLITVVVANRRRNKYVPTYIYSIFYTLYLVQHYTILLLLPCRVHSRYLLRGVLCQQHHSDMIWTCAFSVHMNMWPTLLTYYYLQHNAKQSLSGRYPTPSDHMPITPRIYNVYTYFMQAFKTTTIP